MLLLYPPSYRLSTFPCCRALLQSSVAETVFFFVSGAKGGLCLVACRPVRLWPARVPKPGTRPLLHGHLSTPRNTPRHLATPCDPPRRQRDRPRRRRDRPRRRRDPPATEARQTATRPRHLGNIPRHLGDTRDTLTTGTWTPIGGGGGLAPCRGR